MSSKHLDLEQLKLLVERLKEYEAEQQQMVTRIRNEMQLHPILVWTCKGCGWFYQTSMLWRERVHDMEQEVVMHHLWHGKPPHVWQQH